MLLFKHFFLNKKCDFIEFEIRFGTYIGNKFVSGIRGDSFYHILDILKSQGKFVEETNTIEKVYNIPFDLQSKTSLGKKQSVIKEIMLSGKAFYQVKELIEQENRALDLPIRISVSKEVYVSPEEGRKIISQTQKEPYIRSKERFSYQLGVLRVDFTIANGDYELELEYIGEHMGIQVNDSNCDNIISEIQATVNFITQNIQDNYLITPLSVSESVMQKVSKLYNKKHEQIKVTTLTENRLKNLGTQKFLVSEKIDGERAFVYISLEGVFVIVDSQVKTTNYTVNTTKELLLDAEWIKITKDGKVFNGVVLFDTLVPFEKSLEKRLQVISNLKFNVSQITRVPEDLQIRILKKKYHCLSKETIEASLTTKFDYKTDGIVFSSDDSVMKWKPRNLITNDYYIEMNTTPEIHSVTLYCITDEANSQYKVRGVPLENFKVKQNSGRKQPTVKQPIGIHPVQYRSGIVIEAVIDSDTCSVTPVKIRWDKLKNRKLGNYNKVALDNWESHRNFVDLPKILEFSQRSISALFSLRTFHNRVKSELFKVIQKGDRVLDLACGKGGDFHKYNKADVAFVIGYDKSGDSITELKSRFPNETSCGKFSVYPLDLSKELVFNHLQDVVVDTDFDIVSCQFAMHYFLESEETFRTFLRSVSENLKSGGKFIGTVLDSSSVRQVLKDGIFEIPDKVYLKTLSSLGMNSPFGHELSVQLSDTVLETPTPEFLVDFDVLEHLFNEYGLKLTKKVSFKTLGKKDNLKEYYKSMGDLCAYSDLNCTFTFEKTSPSKFQLLRCSTPASLKVSVKHKTTHKKTEPGPKITPTEPNWKVYAVPKAANEIFKQTKCIENLNDPSWDFLYQFTKGRNIVHFDNKKRDIKVIPVAGVENDAKWVGILEMKPGQFRLFGVQSSWEFKTKLDLTRS